MESEQAMQEQTGGENIETGDAQQQQPTGDDNKSSSSVGDSVTIAISRDEFARMLADSANAAADSAASAVGTQVSEHLASGGTVALVQEQYDGLKTMDAAQLHGVVFAIGLLSLILGAIVAVGMTLHMRGARNG